MATPVDIEAELTVEIDGPVVTPEKFLRGVEAFFAVLSEVTRTLTPEGERAEWTVQVKQGSNLVGVRPVPGTQPAIVSQVIAAMSGGLAALEREPIEPPQFTERALRNLRTLARLTEKSDTDDTRQHLGWNRALPDHAAPGETCRRDFGGRLYRPRHSGGQPKNNL
jgi:hypothetical protein